MMFQRRKNKVERSNADTSSITYVSADALANADSRNENGPEYNQVTNELAKGYCRIGMWRNMPLDWRVLKVEHGCALLICSEVLEQVLYHDDCVNTTWEKCSLRKWLNGEFLSEAFSDSERTQIIESNTPNPDHIIDKSVEGHEFHTKGGLDTKDRVFCLSLNEVKTLFQDDADRKCRLSACLEEESEVSVASDRSVTEWWLRSPGFRQYNAAAVCADGTINEYGWEVKDNQIGVRPALWIKFGL